MAETNESNTTPALTLEQVRDSILDHLEQGNAGHYRIGQLYNYTVDTRLAEKNGYDSAQLFFSQEIQALSQATLTRYGAVAREFTEEACTKYGVINLTTLRTYANAAEFELTSDDPGSTPIDVPQKDGGALMRKSFSDCSLEELRLAVKHKRAPSQKAPPASEMARIELMRESLSRHFAKGARVQLKTNSSRGKTLVTIQGVPLADMERLMEALMDGLIPPPVRAAG
ncbi:hypothetical protein [Archangium sp.]|uniref:hypothetical protein n=1 Tax=Archangium sp. TaxID=1872627 RepID=UPI00286B8152|nr:hypothetical protein [Archangium sp.]